jgi:hypothetical protein
LCQTTAPLVSSIAIGSVAAATSCEMTSDWRRASASTRRSSETSRRTTTAPPSGAGSTVICVSRATRAGVVWTRTREEVSDERCAGQDSSSDVASSEQHDRPTRSSRVARIIAAAAAFAVVTRKLPSTSSTPSDIVSNVVSHSRFDRTRRSKSSAWT